MELIRISDSKLKIMLTPMDMRQFELSSDNFYDDSEKMHQSFRLLLDEIRRQSGFEADDHRISVQYFPSREGGCEMFISNLSPERNKKTCALTPAQGMQPAPRTRGSFSRSFAYRFEGLEALLSVCRRLLPMDYISASSAYRDDSGKYYLCLAAEYTGERRKIGDFEAEFGNVPPRADFSAEMKGYFDEKIKSLEKTVRGKIKGGEEYPAELRLLNEYAERTKK